MEKKVESLAGYVEHIIYRNVDNGYTVLNHLCRDIFSHCRGRKY